MGDSDGSSSGSFDMVVMFTLCLLSILTTVLMLISL
jgi:hypothetical protein